MSLGIWKLKRLKKPSQNELLSRRKLQINNNSGELMAYWEHALSRMKLLNKIKEKCSSSFVADDKNPRK